VDSLRALLGWLDGLGTWLAPLGLRLLLAWEFWLAGVEKYHGRNWFSEFREQFPFPFHLLPPEISWRMVLWFELIGAVALLLGLATRFVALALSLLTVAAVFAVHADAGYNVCDNGWKLPLLYLVMLLPLILGGPGKLSLDCWLRGRYLESERRLWS